MIVNGFLGLLYLRKRHELKNPSFKEFLGLQRYFRKNELIARLKT
ncbi:hypothetical protein LEP1GSC016_0643 [Leptospira borgpetersenii serovar Hardjo-bovis str. Sponselee]|uniref:Uncharacterized protein n=6 Tax=Leptospira borgpetersenii TaxID=174 RepID=M3HIR2_LEPBO|nr:hypothetical protein LBBP_01479 [Leptospira borgpetersenii serovar Ballum]EKP12020.1 hypothetical protein LEP1GSC128_0166 [Leptospira borgpetersenii str. 200801926]EKQ90974.1 hypothetical protein LEP1GSC101_1289 [Leptospira borgpetersenii str. UI 09149]EKR00608.1 hypothetical protein LEP1GSC121_1284 [Leptospira borgpetersenii serovar Castellonis str. 200801910]EMF97559.1 hypothetical protein LEP1GSC123_1594 [Leptospira borgpetersenii str. 200701203]EMJ81278.1 hypothetical protein LEP1GSC016